MTTKYHIGRMTKLYRKSLAGAIAAAALSCSTHAAVIWTADFTDSESYEAGTLAGQNGWAHLGSGAAADAAIVSDGSGGQILRLSASTAEMNEQIDFATIGDGPFSGIVQITATVGWVFPSSSASANIGNISFAIGRHNTVLSLVHTTNGGIYAYAGTGNYATATTRVPLLDGSLVQSGNLYHFTAVIDLDAHTFNVLLTGTDANGDPVHASESNISYTLTSYPSAIPGVTLNLANPTQNAMLLSHLDVRTIPEPATVGMLMTGGLLLLGMKRRRRQSRRSVRQCCHQDRFQSASRRPVQRVSTAILSVVALSSGAQARELVADFEADPSYPVHQSIVGEKGWIAREIQSGNDDDASMILLDGERKVLQVHSSTTESPRRTRVGMDFTPWITSRHVEAEVRMGWSNPSAGSRALLSFGLGVANTPAQIGNDPEVGIYVSTGFYSEPQTLVLLEKERVKPGYLYQFSLTCDLAGQMFDVTLTGVDVENTPVAVTRKGISFSDLGGVNGRSIKGITASIDGGNTNAMYIARVKLSVE